MIDLTITRQPIEVTNSQTVLEATLERRALEVTITPSQGPPGPRGPAGEGIWVDQVFTPEEGQTEFVLDVPPLSNNSVFLFINNDPFLPGNGFIISGTLIVWQNAFIIEADDSVVVRYMIA